MKVKILTKCDEEAYSKFIQNHPNGLFYHSLKYRDFLLSLLDCEQNYLVAFKDNVIHGVLPMIKCQFDGRVVYNSLPYFGSHGSFVVKSKLALKSLLGAYKECLNSLNVISSTVISLPGQSNLSNMLPYNYIDYRVGQKTYFPCIREGCSIEENLLIKLDPSARRNIKKSIANNVEVEIDNSKLDVLAKMHSDNILAINGVVKSNRFFESISLFFEPGLDFNVFIAKKEGVIISALLLFYYKNTVEYFVPATLSKYRVYQPSALIILKAMSKAVSDGYNLWNWGGTWPNQDGVYRFKKKWGAIDSKYFYYTQLNSLDLLSCTKDEILEQFPNFYILPFSMLEEKI